MQEKELSAIRAKGGYARANALSKERRVEIAKNAIAARWALRATHKGNFKQEFGIDVDCYVLNDADKTAVISKRGMAAALGYTGESGSRFQRLLDQKRLDSYVGPELRQKIENPFIFQASTAGPNMPENTVHGYDVTVLIDICQAILKAKNDGVLTSSQSMIAQQAQVILSASAKSGIKGLVYALAGFQPEIQAVIDAFRKYVQQEAKKYEKEFPTELYKEWHRLYCLDSSKIGRGWRAMHLTVDHIYTPLARSDGRLLALLRSAKEAQGDRNKKLFQFLNEVGAKALRLHIGRVLGIAEVSPDRETYERRIKEVFGEDQITPEILPISQSGED